MRPNASEGATTEVLLPHWLHRDTALSLLQVPCQDGGTDFGKEGSL